ncbi:Arginine exporter protein ArgO [Raoultella terrigena]|uniref:Arginine exporter protein ArgO n=1 Tax=Raoultella terrigena TaxID=577 RepID=A0A4V6J1Z1_RAOTE|nr:Arginine exporter protein ArgO [Raoultella terrigena]
MLSYYFQGLALGAAMILPLGPQNAFVMNQGIRRQYHLMIALLCAISDLLLICAGIFGGSALLMQSPWLLALVTWGGVAFLLWYGFGALKTAFSDNLELASAEVMKQGRWKIIVTMLAVTWLNPHVYLDTFVVLGSLGGQLAVEPKTLVCARHHQRLFPVVLRSGPAGGLAGAAFAHRPGAADH